MRDQGSAWLTVALRSRRVSLTNFGDELSRVVLEEATGRTVRWAPLGSEDVSAIGSNLIPYVRRGGVGLLWGIGMHEPILEDHEKTGIGEKALAIRGPDTRDFLGLAAGTPLGDPGLIARHLVPSGVNKSGVKLLIAHVSAFATRENRAKIKELVTAGYELALPNLPPREMIRRIAAADFVASSGMHGVILAHAIGTPANLITFSDDTNSRAGFKYFDYHHSVGLEPDLHRWSELVESTSKRSLRIAGAEARAERVSASITPLITGLLQSARVMR
jgi:hypothetical protein